MYMIISFPSCNFLCFLVGIGAISLVLFSLGFAIFARMGVLCFSGLCYTYFFVTLSRSLAQYGQGISFAAINFFLFANVWPMQYWWRQKQQQIWQVGVFMEVTPGEFFHVAIFIVRLL